MPSAIVIACSRAIADHHLSIAFAESATAGRLSYEFSQVPDSGKIFKGGLICYDVCIKEDILGIPAEMIEQYTPESSRVTEELARRMLQFIPSDIVVAVTGLTTPGGSESPDKPVGTMFIHIIAGNVNISSRKVFAGSPEEIILQTVDHAAQLILDAMKGIVE
jgi:nicotinamide-nucleotide amidase